MVDQISGAGQQLPEDDIIFRTNDKEVNADNIKILLEKPGRFTLDDAGNICIVNPPRKRDNFLVSFFRGHIKGTKSERAAYREKERMYDRVADFAHSLKYQKQIIHALQGKKNEADSIAFRQNLYAIGERLKVYMSTHKGGLSTEALRSLDERAKDVSSMVSDSMSNARMLEDSGSGGFIHQNRQINVFKFMEQNLPPEAARIKFLSGDKGIDGSGMAFLVQKLISRCLICPRDFEGIGLKVEAGTIRNNVVSGKRISFTNDIIVGQSLTRMLKTFNLCLSGFASQALKEGRHPRDVAQGLRDILQEICYDVGYDRKSSKTLRNIFAVGLMESRISKMAKPSLGENEQDLRECRKNELTTEYRIGNSLRAYAGCSLDNAFRAMSWIKEEGVSMETYGQFLQLINKNFKLAGAFVPGETPQPAKGMQDYLRQIGDLHEALNKELGENKMDLKVFSHMMGVTLALNPRHRKFITTYGDMIKEQAKKSDQQVWRQGAAVSTTKTGIPPEYFKVCQQLERLGFAMDYAKSFAESGMFGDGMEYIEEVSRKRLQELSRYIGIGEPAPEVQGSDFNLDVSNRIYNAFQQYRSELETAFQAGAQKA